MTMMISEARREQLREWGRRGGKARAALPDFREHQSRAGRRSAAVNDMSALGHLGAQAFIRKYGYIRFFCFWRNWKLANPSRPERQVMGVLEGLGYRYEREAMVLGPEIPVAVDFYVAEAHEAVIEVAGRVHFEPLFEHPNKPETRRRNDLQRIYRLERAGFRVLELDYLELVNEFRTQLKVAAFLVNF